MSSEDEDAKLLEFHRKRTKLKELETKRIDWKFTIFNIVLLLICLGSYGYYTHGAFFKILPDKYKPIYVIREPNGPYNTTSRDVTKSELYAKIIKLKRGYIYISELIKNLKWHAKENGYHVICVHHLLHDLETHPRICILNNKMADQMYSMINLRITGRSLDLKKISQTSLALGISRTDFERSIKIQISYISHPDNFKMYAQFSNSDAATLQLVIDEMDNKLH